MPFVHGKSTYVAIGTAGSETNISTYCKKVQFPDTVGKADTTTFGSTDESSLPGVKSHTVTVSGLWDQTLHNTLTALIGVAGKSIIYGPQGNTTGQAKRSALGYVLKYTPGSDVGAAEDFSLEFQVSGAVTDGVF